MHWLGGPCNCGVDHSAEHRPASLHKSSPAPTPGKITQSHKTLGQPDYTHQYGEHLRLIRYGRGKHKKLFWQHFDRNYGWIDGKGGYEPDFYCADEIAAADPRRPVFWVGGELCVDELRKRGALAGCNPGGENGQWDDAWGELLKGRPVILLNDADESGKGRRHTENAGAHLTAAASIRLIELEGAHDVADWLAAGHTLLELLEIVAVAPVWQREIKLDFHDPSPSSPTTPAYDELKTAYDTLLAQNRSMNEKLLWIFETLAVPQERMSHSEKCLLIVARRNAEWRSLTPSQLATMTDKAREVVSEGYRPDYLGALGEATGMSEGTAGKNLRTLQDMGALQLKPFSEVEDGVVKPRLAYTIGAVIDQPKVWMPKDGPRNNRGGHRPGAGRPKQCTECGSEQIAERTVRELVERVVIETACKDCGAISRRTLSEEVIGRETVAEREIKVDFHETPDERDERDEGSAPEGRETKDTPPPVIHTPQTLRSPETMPAGACPVTGGAHIYKMWRTADGRYICTECETPEEAPARIHLLPQEGRS